MAAILSRGDESNKFTTEILPKSRFFLETDYDDHVHLCAERVPSGAIWAYKIRNKLRPFN